jgi:mono/diheme cytochrome c family protein
LRIFAIFVLAGIAPLAVASAGEQHAVTQLSEVQSLYLQHCGGCHGIQGDSAPREIPSLRGQVGSFLCTAEGRAYLIRLPNIALAPVSDQKLADVMNFVVFELGGPAVQSPRYTAAEVAQLRARPLTDTGLADYRARIVKDLIRRCGAPVSLRTYSVEPLQ